MLDVLEDDSAGRRMIWIWKERCVGMIELERQQAYTVCQVVFIDSARVKGRDLTMRIKGD